MPLGCESSFPNTEQKFKVRRTTLCLKWSWPEIFEAFQKEEGEVLYFISLCVVCVCSCGVFLSILYLKIAEKKVLAI